MKISSTLLIVRNENAKYTGRIFLIYHCQPPLVGENMGKERIKVIWQYLSEIQLHMAFDSVIPLLGCTTPSHPPNTHISPSVRDCSSIWNNHHLGTTIPMYTSTNYSTL